MGACVCLWRSLIEQGSPFIEQLYEALTVIFIAQMHDEPLTLGMMIVIAATSTLAAVGAAAIPSAGLVTMVMVLQAAGLDQYVADLSIIFTIDWALDRVRTVCNVMGDSFGAAIVQHVCYDTSYERASSSSPAVTAAAHESKSVTPKDGDFGGNQAALESECASKTQTNTHPQFGL